MKNKAYFLTKFLFILALSISFFSVSAQSTTDTLKEKLDEVNDRVTGINERLQTAESDLAKHNKIKVSGYIQAQFEHYDNPSIFPANQFIIRRTRIKFTYEAADGVKFVLVPDFVPGNIDVKEAFMQLNDHWTNTMSLTVGKFNRPDYEVEYSSSQNELLERSRVIKSLYPGEYAIGAKFEYKPKSFPLKVQAALLNGNDYITTYVDAAKTNINPNNRDFDNYKDLMVRATYSLKLGKSATIDFGGHAYYGGVKANSTTTINGKYVKDSSPLVGDKLNRNWIGAEFQLYADVLGGLSLKGEFITGQNANPGYSSTTNSSTSSSTLKNDTLTLTTTNIKTSNVAANQVTKFSGYYLTLIKNIGKSFQIAARYDVYDPNTSLSGTDLGIVSYVDPSNGTVSNTSSTTSVSGNQVIINKTVTNTVTNFTARSGKADLKYSTLMLAIHYYFDDNIRISLGYEMPVNEKTTAGKVVDSYTVNNVPGTLDYSKTFPQHMLTLRFQAKF